MSASHAPALDAIALQLAASLEKYDHDVALLLESCLDIDLYRQVSEEVERIRLYSSALPEARVQWVELLIAHAELVHCLWRSQQAKAVPPKESVSTVRERHSLAVAALRQRCGVALSRPGPG